MSAAAVDTVYTANVDPGYVQFHGENSDTFSLPEGFREQKVPLPYVWDHHLKHSARHPLFIYNTNTDLKFLVENADSDVVKSGIRTISWGQTGRAVHRAGRIVDDAVKKNFAGASGFVRNIEKPIVVGILALKDSPTYWAVMAGAIRAGHAIFVISPRNSPVAVAHLLKATQCSMLYVSEDKSMQGLSAAAVALAQKEHGWSVAVEPMLSYEDLYDDGKENTDFETLPDIEFSMSAPALLAHSSGSTAFPKPRVLTHKMLVQWAQYPIASSDGCGRVVGASSLPLFHIMGFYFTMTMPTGIGSISTIFPIAPPGSPPILPSPDLVLAGAIGSRAHCIITVPTFVQAWAQNPTLYPAMRRFDYVAYAGGPLKREAGDKLVAEGVRIVTGFGATEYGVNCDDGYGNIQHNYVPNEDWEYVNFHVRIGMHFEQQKDEPNLYELYILETPVLTPCVINGEINGKPAFATSDLFIPHPTKKGFWKIHGRVDDQIIHSNGEKTNPGPLEGIISSHPSVTHAIIFGRGQPQTGVLVNPIPGKGIDAGDEKALEKFRNEIWSAVEEANRYAPTHSRVFKEMIIVANTSKPLQLTAKGTVRRQVMINEYAEEIAAAYALVESSSVRDIKPPASWNKDQTVTFVKEIAQKILGKSVGDEEDLFQVGADSLHATLIRNSILHALRQSKVSTKITKHINQDLVYSYPTIASLGTHISQIASGTATAGPLSKEEKVALMEELFKKYTKDFPVHRPSAQTNGGEAESVLITGTTGILGALILAKVLEISSIKRIYLVNRVSNTNTRDRHLAVFQKLGLNATGLLDANRVLFIVADPSESHLGLADDLYDEILSNVTSIIHCAWRVDFNIALPSFEPLIKSVKNIINVALSSKRAKPPKLLFMSSIASLNNYQSKAAIKEVVFNDASTAIGNGYGESKWVAEHIIDIANSKTLLKGTIARIGQLSGSTINGYWNPTEWFPAIIQIASVVKCVPSNPGAVSWLPIDVAASVIVQMRSEASPVVHIAHPRPVSWKSIIDSVSEIAGVPVVPYSQWLAALEQAASATMESGMSATSPKYPAFHLLNFYRSRESSVSEDADSDAVTGAKLDLIAAKASSNILADPALPQLSSSSVAQWLSYLKCAN